MPRNRQTLLRTHQGRLAVVGAASLVSVLVSAPVAVADGAEPTQTASAAGSTGAPAAVAPEVQQPAEPVAPPEEPPAEQPVAPLVEQPAEQPNEEPVAPPVEQPAAPPVQPQSEQPADTSTDEPVEQPAAPQPRADGADRADGGDLSTSASVPGGVSATSSSAGASSTGSGAGQASDDREGAAILADFGNGKFRAGGYQVRVDVAEGSALRAGATTAGSTFRISDSGTGGVAPEPSTCTTETMPSNSGPFPGSMPSAPGTETFCVLNPVPNMFESRYTGYPTGPSRVTVRQLTAAAGLAVDPDEQTFDFAPVLAECDTETFPAPESFFNCVFSSHTFVFSNAALLRPVAVPDVARTPRGTRVVVVVQRNDKLFGLPATGLVVKDAPAHGTATVVDGRVRYVPRRGFVGTDTFTYTIRTASGESTATVTVTIPARGAAATNDDRDPVAPTAVAQAAPAAAAGTAPTSARASSSEQSGASASTLPNTGGPEGILLGLGALLLAAGGRLVAGGRRPGRGAGHA